MKSWQNPVHSLIALIFKDVAYTCMIYYTYLHEVAIANIINSVMW